MTIDAIRLFTLAAKHLSVSKAARQIPIDRSAASRKLKRLERNLGVKLFKPIGRGIEITKIGKTFLNEVSPILAKLDELLKRYTRSRESLALPGNHSNSTYLLPSLMARFSTSHPSAKLELHTTNSTEIEEMLGAGTVDLAIITSPTLSAKCFNMESYRNEQLTAFVTASNPLAQRKTVKPSELGEIRLIIRIRKEGQSRTEAELARLANKGVKLKIPIRCDTPAAVKEAVRDGAGIGILFRDTVKREIDQGEFQAIQIEGFDVTGQSYIVYSKEKPLSPLAREFLELLRESAAKDALVTPVTRQMSRANQNGLTRGSELRSKLLSGVISMAPLHWSLWGLSQLLT